MIPQELQDLRRSYEANSDDCAYAHAADVVRLLDYIDQITMTRFGWWCRSCGRREPPVHTPAVQTVWCMACNRAMDPAYASPAALPT